MFHVEPKCLMNPRDGCHAAAPGETSHFHPAASSDPELASPEVQARGFPAKVQIGFSETAHVPRGTLPSGLANKTCGELHVGHPRRTRRTSLGDRWHFQDEPSGKVSTFSEEPKPVKASSLARAIKSPSNLTLCPANRAGTPRERRSWPIAAGITPGLSRARQSTQHGAATCSDSRHPVIHSSPRSRGGDVERLATRVQA